MNNKPLPNEEIVAWILEQPAWALSEDGTSISRQFKFRNFIEAFAFMTQCALFAEKIDHHPEWLNVYSKVSVTLTTHSAKGVTRLDFNLAAFMDQAFERITATADEV